MKTILAAVIALMAIAPLASNAKADRFHGHRHPMKVCSMMHHHRVCHMVMR